MNVAYIYFSTPHLWKVAKHLEQAHQWKPTYWCADISTKEVVEKAFPDITFQDYISCRRAIHTNELKSVKQKPIDQKLIDALAVDQITAMKIFYRHDATGDMFNFNDLIEHYYEMIKYWTTVIEEKKIDLFVSWTSPHGTEYVLYMLAKYYGIPWLYIDAAYCVTKDTHLIASSIENRAKLLKEKYDDAEAVFPPPEPETIAQIEKVLSNYEIAKPDYMSYPEYFGEKGKLFKKVFNTLLEIAYLFRRGIFKNSGSHFKFKRGPYRDEDTSGNHLQYYLFEKRMGRLGKLLKKVYLPYIVEPDFSKKYVFFAAPFQPEASTLPDAGIFNYVPLMLEMLSDAIPDDWLIYYKEHPATFDAIVSRDLYRGPEYYKTVANISKVKMVDHRIDTFQLVDNSQCVATPTGTVGWESVVRGKPCITFGEVWYNPCDGVFNIKTREDLQAAISKIQNGFVPTREKILRFASVVDKHCAKNFRYLNFSTRWHKIPNLDEELKKYGEVLFKAYHEYKVNK